MKHLFRTIFIALAALLFSIKAFSINPPAAVGSSANIILWLHPDSAVYNSSGTLATIGQDVAEWKDISGNGFDFSNTFSNRRPVLTTHNSKRFLDFTPGDFLENTAIKDSINGLDEFSIFITVKSDIINTDKGFMDSENPNNTDDKICLRYDRSGANTGRNNCLKAGMNGNSAANQVETQANTQSTNVQTLTLVWEDGEKLLVYINGVLNDSSSATIAAPLAGVSKIILGKGPKDNGGGLGGSSGWDGLIGEVVFYNKKFSSDTIQQVASQISSIKSVKSGNWNDPTIWDCNCVPLDTYNITINTGHTVTLANNVGARNLNVSAGGSLDLSASNFTLSVSQHLNMTGSLIERSGGIAFIGNQNSYATGNFRVHDLTVNKNSGFMEVQSGRLTIENELTVTSGTFRPNNRTTLTSTATNTARIAEVTGNILGSMTIQRYIDGLTNHIGYRHISTPFSNSTIATVQYNATTNPGGILTYGFAGTNYPTAGNGYLSTYAFNEATAAANNDFQMGWTGATSSANNLGYDNALAFYSGGSQFPTYTINATGQPNVGNKTISNLTYGGAQLSAGWHLIGNPYASSLNWGTVTKNGVDATAYIFQETAGGYIASSLLALPNIISSYQGFFIHVNNAANSIQFKESDKASADVSFIRSQTPINRLKISAHNLTSGKKSIVALDFNEYASSGFDPQYDAYKLDNPQDFPSFYFPVANDQLQVNTVSEAEGISEFNLNLQSVQSTKMRIWIEEVPEIDGCLYMRDNKTGNYYPIEDSASFLVEVSANNTLKNRFTIEVLNAVQKLNTTNATCFDKNDGKVEIEFSNFSGVWTLTNQNKKMVDGGYTAYSKINNLAAGYYTLSWEAEHCGSFETKFFITQPEEIESKFEIPNTVQVNEEIIPNNISRGASNFKWFVDTNLFSTETLPRFKFNEVGIFKIALQAINGSCKKTFSSAVEVSGPPEKSITSLNGLNAAPSNIWFYQGHLYWTEKCIASEFKVIGTSGQLIESNSIDNGSTSFDLSHLKHRTYIIEVESEFGSVDRITVIR